MSDQGSNGHRKAIKREPTFAGPAGRAWEMIRGPEETLDQSATLVGFVVNGPFHPAWSWWQVSVIHLRDIPGGRPVNREYPEAAHEFMIASIDPDKPPDPDKPFPQGIRYLRPLDVVEQFHGVTDEQAEAICRDAVQAIVEGKASPDQDWRSWWHGAIQKTVDHYRRGLH